MVKPIEFGLVLDELYSSSIFNYYNHGYLFNIDYYIIMSYE